MTMFQYLKSKVSNQTTPGLAVQSEATPTMADVEMTDAPPASSSNAKGKAVVRSAQGGPGSSEMDNKPRFEVKKV